MLEDVAIPVNVAIFAGSGAVVWLAGTRLAGYADASPSGPGSPESRWGCSSSAE